MDPKELEEQIIENYKRDETVMILVFAQWCINHDLDPIQLYVEAYPKQVKNQALAEAMALTVPKVESQEIPFETLLGVLSMFGNDDLAFVVSEAKKKIETPK